MGSEEDGGSWVWEMGGKRIRRQEGGEIRNKFEIFKEGGQTKT